MKQKHVAVQYIDKQEGACSIAFTIFALFS